jgi:cytochrome c biogenesis protein CcmG, thiol:disulfide interchange protein DsbE
MPRKSLLCLFFVTVAAACVPRAQSQGETQPVLDAIDRADSLGTQNKFQEALDAYREADRISNHTCADCYLGMVNMECQLGDFSNALEDASRAETAAAGDRIAAARACEVRAKLLVDTASGPDDPKVKDAESQLRKAISLDPRKSMARFELGMLLLQEGRDPEGVAELKAFVSGPLASPRYVDRAVRLIADPSRARSLPSEDFSFSTLDSGTISKAGLRGKVVLLDFWASWCGPCRESVPAVADLHRKFADSPFEIVGISSDIDEDAWKQFIAANHMNWPETIDLDGKISKLFDVPGFPTYVVLDRDGAIAFRQTGFGSDSERDIAAAINRALTKPFVAQPAPPSATSVPTPTPSPTPVARPNVRVKFTFPPDDVGNDDVRGNTYRNDLLGLSCKFPAQWTPADPEVLEQLNKERAREIEAATQENPGSDVAPDGSVTLAFEQIVFEASPDPRRLPDVAISVALSGDSAQESAEHGAKDLARNGMVILAAPHEITIAKRPFFRTDYMTPQDYNAAWISIIETTVSRRYLVKLEVKARSKRELDDLVATAQSLSISKP